MRTEPRRRIRWWAALLLVLVTNARADHGEIPLGVSQSLRFTIPSPEEVRLRYSVLVGVMASGPYLAEADLDHSGKLDEAEKLALGQRLAAEVARRLELLLDGRRVTLRFDEVRTAFENDSVGPWPFSVHLAASFVPGRASSHEVQLRGVIPFPRLEETLISVSAVRPVRLLRVLNAAPTEDGAKTSYFRTDGADQPLSFTFTGRQRLVSTRALVRGAMAFGVLIIAGGLLLLRRRPRAPQERNPSDAS